MAGGSRPDSDEMLVTALAAGKMRKDAAEMAGVSERTVYARLADAGFRGRAAELRREMIERAVGELSDATAEAARALRALLSAESEAVRLRAACAILDQAVKLRDHAELCERVEEIERRLGGGPNVDPKPDCAA